MNNFELFQQRKEKLSSLLDETSRIFQEINEESEIKTLSELKNKLRDNNFKVLVIGEFKRGKSTFINALLHEEILPAYSVPCTAIINEIKYGKEKKAIIYFKEKIAQIPEGLADDIKSYINEHKGDGAIPPLTVPFDKLEEYVTITDVEKEQAESVAESPFERAEIYVPLDLCRDGVEIIDSPGLNEHGTRSAVTNRYAEHVDAIIFVLLCQPLASGSELESIDTLRRAGHEDIFFICNSFDLIRDKEKPRVIQMAHTRLGSRTNLGERGLHFVSSLDALEARTVELDGDKIKEREEASNFPQMEAALNDFLVNDRGRIKLQLPSATITQKLTKNLPAEVAKRKSLLEKSTKELKDKFDKYSKEVEDLKKREETNMDNLSGKIAKIEQLMERTTTDFILDVAQNVPGWVNECEPSAGLGVLFTTKADIENVSEELVAYATARIKEAQEEWRENIMIPRISEEVEKFRALAEDYIKDFEERINAADDEFASAEREQDEDALSKFYVDNGIEQTIMTDLVKTAAPSVALGIGMAFVGLLSPWLLIPALLGAGGLSRFFNKGAKMESIKSAVGEKLKEQIRNQGFEKLQSTPNTLSMKLNEIVERFRTVFESKIDAAQARANQALQDSQLGEQEAADKVKLYDEILVRAQQIEKETRELVQSL